jgi:hypothetical protein
VDKLNQTEQCNAAAAYPRKRKCACRGSSHFVIAESAADIYCSTRCERRDSREDYPS